MWPIDHAASLSFDCTECKGPSFTARYAVCLDEVAPSATHLGNTRVELPELNQVFEL